MAISAAQVKELRERTGSGMMECKKALVEADGDMEAAIEALRKSGLAKADKKAGRVAAEGLIVIEISADGKEAALVEVNSETDFVAKKDEFQDFARQVAKRVLASKPESIEALLEMPLRDGEDTTVDMARKELVAKLGENIGVRRFELVQTDGTLGYYLHGSRIGVLVELEGGDEALARDIAMHVAASRPLSVSADDMPQEVLDKEREIIVAQAQESGKPENIIEKMVEGRIRKFLAEVTLLGQPFVKDPDTTVGKLLDKSGAKVRSFRRMELGEGIEKKQENFADEVMAQVRGD
ncbi:translation elongation factor Ts [Thiohalobacter sp. IOR34]|uniref:translation elongation factor Ts n=1 Tax=Thiohalobacter sp. IOR34 TaxID=3057176 RepID=UPI0025AFE7FE|nr:translation elongation factor Ts [Thiohalobacter sp. IOR34]WJW76575.1 translation elongation factor Ts [Thiohalobacter sp. IOR34]